MRGVIEFVLGNFTLTFFVLGLIASAIALWHARQPRSDAVIVEALFSYFLLFSIAIANFYNFVPGHVYQMIAAHHFAPGNAGVIFYSDILVPVVGFLFLWLQRGSEPRQAGPRLFEPKNRVSALHLRSRGGKNKQGTYTRPI